MANNLGSSFAARLGSAFGSGIGSGLQQLTQQRLAEQMQQRQFDLAQRQQLGERINYAQSLIGLGLNPEAALALSGLPEKERIAFFQRGGASALRQQTQQPSTLSELVRSLTPEVQQGITQGIQAIRPESASIAPTYRQQGGSSFLDIMARPSPAEEAQERRHQEKLAERRTEREEKRFDKIIYPKLSKAEEKSEAAYNQNLILDEMGRLTRAGNEQKFLALVIDYFKEKGIDGTALLNADTTEINKLSTYFLRNLKDTFGGRISNQEMERFMQGVPSLMMNPEGRLRVIEMMKIFNNAEIKRHEAMQEILEQKPNITPVQFDKALSQKMKPVHKELEQQFEALAQTAKIQPYNIGQELTTLPRPFDVPKGTQIQAPSGEILVSDGKSWKKKGS
jgi:hypothetical protein